jgi:thioredoxin-related protein
MKYLLFTTSTCVKCPAFKELVFAKVGFGGEVLDEKKENFASLAGQYGVMSVPAILVFDEAENEVFRTGEGSELIDFLDKL